MTEEATPLPVDPEPEGEPEPIDQPNPDGVTDRTVNPEAVKDAIVEKAAETE